MIEATEEDNVGKNKWKYLIVRHGRVGNGTVDIDRVR